MNKRIITIILALAAVCGGASAQPKIGARVPIREKRGYDKRFVIDTASVRVLYALNAQDIKDESTYIDLGKLEVGKRVKKYSSEFINLSDQKAIQWKREQNHQGRVPKSFWINGRNHENWSELAFSDYFVKDGKLTEWACMPLFAESDNGRYTEPWPLMQWTLANDSQTILGHRCQKATCRFRGRNFVAWFAADVPIKGGPWKFGGLPGCILKVYDVQKIYVWEAVAIERGKFLITQYPEKLYPVAKRERIWKLQRRYVEDYWESLGVVWDGRPRDKKVLYEQLEKE